jgi:7-cyano-7-deazaguanine synthase in queuosine biosynthesis
MIRIFLLIILIYLFNNLHLFATYNREFFVVPPPYIDENTIHVFWTGGYDSTFRICQLLIDKGKKVQPIYITYQYIDDTKYGTQRNNRDNEIQTMDTIRSLINTKFPHIKYKLFPTMYINSIEDNSQITNSMYIMHYRHGKFTRPITQYERLSRFSYYYPFPIDVSVEKCGTGMDDATKNLRVDEGTDDCRIPTNLGDDLKSFKILNNLRFPIVHLTKHQMEEIAKKGQYNDILKLTWSCWFPKNGSPCGKCDMCAHRIVPQYNRQSTYIPTQKIINDQKTINTALNTKFIYY